MEERANDARVFAGIVGSVPEVGAVTITDDAGLPLVTAGETDSRRDAVLASFVCSRIVELTAHGDLRGKGRVLGDATLLHASFAGKRGEYLLLPTAGLVAFATMNPGALAETALWRLYNAA